jgi:hypothetical protein
VAAAGTRLEGGAQRSEARRVATLVRVVQPRGGAERGAHVRAASAAAQPEARVQLHAADVLHLARQEEGRDIATKGSGARVQ